MLVSQCQFAGLRMEKWQRSRLGRPASYRLWLGITRGAWHQRFRQNCRGGEFLRGRNEHSCCLQFFQLSRKRRKPLPFTLTSSEGKRVVSLVHILFFQEARDL